MSQQQKDRGPVAIAPSSGTNGGNWRAKSAATKSAQALEDTKPRSFEERWAEAITWMQTAKTAPSVNGDGGGYNVYDTTECSRKEIKELAERGLIDLDTMTWTDQTTDQGLMICFCLVPACRIGHFIPLRKKGE